MPTVPPSPPPPSASASSSPTLRPPVGEDRSERLDAVRAALDEHRYADAWRAARPLGDLRTWRGARERLLAGRLASHLGAQRLGETLRALAGREHPDDLEARLARLGARSGGLGIHRTWNELETLRPRLERVGAETRALWWLHRALLSAAVRDFDAAWRACDEAVSHRPEPWIRLLRAQILEAEDRLDEAQAFVEGLLREHPRERLAIQLQAHFLRQRGLEDEAYTWLREASGRIDYPLIQMQLAEMDMAAERWRPAHDRILRYVSDASALRLDQASRRAVSGLRAQVLYHLGRRLDAADLLEQAQPRHSRNLVQRLRDSDLPDRRRVLDVPWVRQHHDTCSPATLTAVCRYWGRPAEHLEIAEEICYGGTRSHSERRWARENGLVAREFTVDWPTAVELLDRGVPFTLVTADAVNAHLQAVVGYDLRRRSFLCRDPSSRNLLEYDADKMLKALASTGPRGMVLLPPTEARRLDDPERSHLVLPDDHLFDLYDQVESRLATHRRDEAEVAARQLGEVAPGHRLEVLARGALAAYDRDVPRLLTVVEEQLESHPEDDRLQLLRLSLLADLERPDERVLALREQAERHGSDPSFRVLLARELLRDAARWRDAESLLERAVRDRPNQADAFDVLAQLAWLRGDRDAARRLHRWAACLAEAVEIYSAHFLLTSRETDRTCEALEFLQRRFERFGRRSPRPAMTLVFALELLDRDDEAAAVLTEAADLHPDDGDLALFRVGHLARRSRLDEARELLERFDGRADPGSWLERRAEVAEIEGDLATALDAERRLVAKEPTSVERHLRLARLLALVEGRPTALDHLRDACATFPHHVALAELRTEWARDDGPERVVEVVLPLLDRVPDNAWAWRELAGARLLLGETEAAEDAMERAARLEPDSPALENLRAQLADDRGQTALAASHYRRAIELDPDGPWALSRLPATCRDAEERSETLAWMCRALTRSTTGTGVGALHEQLARYLPPPEVETRLRELLAARELWPVRRALVAQVAQQGRLEEALELARDAVDRYPFQTGLRLLQARIHQTAGQTEQERAALDAVLTLEPGNGEARVALARLHLAERRNPAAREEVATARARNPFDPEPLLVLADLHWAEGDLERCLERLEEALELEPERDELWSSFEQLAHDLDQTGRPETLARRLLESRRTSAHAWATLARVAAEPRAAREAIDAALELSPRSVELHALKARILARQGDLAAAFAACRVPIEGRSRPSELILQEAEILAQDGKVDRAVDLLRGAVDDDPAFRAGWQRLTEWAVEQERWPLALSASRAWTDLAPLEPVALGHRGAALRGADRPDEAVAALRRALDIDPRYAYAGFELAELLTERGEGREALHLFARCADASAAGAVLAKAVTLAALHGGHVHAGRWIQGMALDPATPPALLHELLDAVEGGRHHYLKLYDQAALGPEVRAPLMAVRVARIADATSVDAAWHFLAPRHDATDAWAEAALALLELDAKAGRAVWRVKQHQEKLTGPYRSWSYVGFVYARAADWRQVVAVLGSYPKRRDVPGAGVEAWVLHLLVVAHRQRREFETAYEVALDGLRAPAPPDDPAVADLRVWTALWEALHDRPDAARALPERLDHELERAPRLFFRMAKALAACAGRPGDAEAYEEARRWLRGALPPVRCADPSERSLYARVARRIARTRGGFWARLWAETHLPR